MWALFNIDGSNSQANGWQFLFGGLSVGFLAAQYYFWGVSGWPLLAEYALLSISSMLIGAYLGDRLEKRRDQGGDI